MWWHDNYIDLFLYKYVILQKVLDETLIDSANALNKLKQMIGIREFWAILKMLNAAFSNRIDLESEQYQQFFVLIEYFQWHR